MSKKTKRFHLNLNIWNKNDHGGGSFQFNGFRIHDKTEKKTHWLTILHKQYNDGSRQLCCIASKRNYRAYYNVENMNAYCCFVSCFLYILIRHRTRKRIRIIKKNNEFITKMLDEDTILLQVLTKIMLEYLAMGLWT